MKELIDKSGVKKAFLIILICLIIQVLKFTRTHTIIIQNYENVAAQRDRRYLFSGNALYIMVKNSIGNTLRENTDSRMFVYMNQDVVQEQQLGRFPTPNYQRYHYISKSPLKVPNHLSDLINEQIYLREQDKLEKMVINGEQRYKVPLLSQQNEYQQEEEAMSPENSLLIV